MRGARLDVIRRKARTVILDLRYGRILSGVIPTRYEHLGARATSNSDYSTLEMVFQGRIGRGDVLVDVGCGKGRVLNWWLSQGLQNQLIGIELDRDIAEHTRRRLRRFHNVEIITGNVIDKLPANGTLFYLFNPFGATTMRLFKSRLLDILSKRAASAATLIYYNCIHLNVFLGDPRCTVEKRTHDHPYAIIDVNGELKRQ